jgi:hypothetical protein
MNTKNKKFSKVFYLSLMIFSMLLTSQFLVAMMPSVVNTNSQITPSTSIEVKNSVTLPVQIWNHTWQPSFPSNLLGGVIDGNFIYTSAVIEMAPSDARGAVLKYDLDGNLIWQHIYNDSTRQTVFSDITVDSAHNLYVTGNADNEYMDQDLFIVKFDSNGNFLWNLTWDAGTHDQEIGEQIALDSNNNIYIVGYFINLSVAGYRPLFLKFDSNGNHLWNQTWIYNNDTGFGHDLAIAGNYLYVTGRTNCLGYHGFLTKYDLDGILIWNRMHNAPYDKSHIALDSSKNIYLVRDTGYAGHVRTVKYDPSGNVLWNTTVGNNIRDWGYDVVIDKNNYIYIAGLSEVNTTINFDFLFAILYPNGTLFWNTTWGRSDCSEIANTILLDSNLKVYIAGYIYNVSADESHSFIAKFNVSLPLIPGSSIPGFQFIFVLFPLFLLFGLMLIIPKSRRMLFFRGK